MPIQRVFLGWRKPALHTAANYLVSRYDSNRLADLSSALVVLPSSRAGRRLREVLIAETGRRECGFFPPQICTMGALPEFLYEHKKPFATTLVQQLAWAQALRKSDRDRLATVVPELPEHADDPRWLELASLFRQQHRELAADGLDFADVADQGQRLDEFNESARWKIMAEVQQQYLRQLDDLGQWDRQTARLYAIEHRECHSDRQIILLGTVDMSRSVRAMLDQVASKVTSLVCAPDTLAHLFDEHGCVIPDAWQDARIDVASEQIMLADGPSSQADAVIYAITELNERFRADQVTVGIPNATLLPHVETKLEQFDLPSRWGPGSSIWATRPVLFLRCVVDYIRHQRFRDLSELIRHPDVEQWMAAKGGGQLSDNLTGDDTIIELDKYFESHLLERIPLDGELPGRAPGAIGVISELLRPLQTKRQLPGEWTETLISLLVEVYGDRVIDSQSEERATLIACQELRQAIAQLRELPPSLASQVDASTAILMALGQIAQTEVPTPQDADAIEMLGWLELPFDDAPCLIVTGLNEGYVPQSINSDLFLPNGLRRELGIDDNERRYARDAYALQVLLASREHLRIVVGRRTAEGDPLYPSRLLLAADQHMIAERCLRFFDPDGADVLPTICPASPRDSHGFCVPRPKPLTQPVTSLSPTDFRSFLACRYRFYLQRILRLETVAAASDELDPRLFGTLAHDVLSDFGTSPCRDATDPLEIAEYLIDRMQERSRDLFGSRPAPVVQVQLAQLRLRMTAFAQRQAEWRLSGWKITQHIEVDAPGRGVPFPVDGQHVYLRGRIDRIDVHEPTGDYVVLDYKTSEVAAHPDKKHRARVPQESESATGRVWIDLQLPIYRHIARALPIQGRIRMGYVLLPKGVEQTAFTLAEWTEQELEEADDVAREVVRQIRSQDYWPPADPAPPFLGREVGPICQDGVFNRQLQQLDVST